MKRLKYENKPLFLISAVLWIGAMICNFVLSILYFVAELYLRGSISSFLCILQLLIAVYYFNLNKRTYICIEEKVLTIDRGLIRKAKCVEFTNINEVTRGPNVINIKESKGRVVKVRLYLLNDFDLEILFATFKELGFSV